MSSLPQAWHSIPVPIRNGTSTTPEIQATGEEWDSHLCYETLPSKLPVYKPSTAKLHIHPMKGILPSRDISKPSSSGPKNADSTGIPKPLTTKLYLDEIAKLRKKLTKLETEKSFLEAKLRKANEENMGNSKEIEKLKFELKAAQKEFLVHPQNYCHFKGVLKEKNTALNILDMCSCKHRSKIPTKFN
ncbi:uncharacterized protein LOC129981516 isoform X1 [Argiope bruennichi]|nr:uncharacterized protein LOC129981516 isoform X1 [Argiope bruennichi]